MNIMMHISDLLIPLIIFMTVGYGIAGKVRVYEAFLKGAKDGLKTVVEIVPTLIGLMTAVGILRASGFFDFIGMLIAPVTDRLNLPAEIVTLLAVKMFSSSASTGLVLDIFKNYGPDSYAGMLASILMSCTDTMIILRRSEEYLQKQGFRACPYFSFFTSPVNLNRHNLKLS